MLGYCQESMTQDSVVILDLDWWLQEDSRMATLMVCQSNCPVSTPTLACWLARIFANWVFFILWHTDKALTLSRYTISFLIIDKAEHTAGRRLTALNGLTVPNNNSPIIPAHNCYDLHKKVLPDVLSVSPLSYLPNHWAMPLTIVLRSCTGHRFLYTCSQKAHPLTKHFLATRYSAKRIAVYKLFLFCSEFHCLSIFESVLYFPLSRWLCCYM